MIDHWRGRYPKKKTNRKVIYLIIILLIVIFFITQTDVFVEQFGRIFFDTHETQQEIQE